jgi:hypothetical protein
MTSRLVAMPSLPEGEAPHVSRELSLITVW